MPVTYNAIPKIAASVKDVVEVALAKTAADTETLAKFNAPVITGNLRGSIAAAPVRELTWRVTASADYALYVEVGARGRSGRWYLTNALKETEPALMQALKGLV